MSKKLACSDYGQHNDQPTWQQPKKKKKKPLVNYSSKLISMLTASQPYLTTSVSLAGQTCFVVRMSVTLTQHQQQVFCTFEINADEQHPIFVSPRYLHRKRCEDSKK